MYVDAKKRGLKIWKYAIKRYICIKIHGTAQLLTFKTFFMNKAQLIDAIAASAKLTKVDSKKALDAFIKETAKSLKKGDKVALVGFGTFSVTKRGARKGRNPRTGKEIQIPAKKVVKFKPGSELGKLVK